MKSLHRNAKHGNTVFKREALHEHLGNLLCIAQPSGRIASGRRKTPRADDCRQWQGISSRPKAPLQCLGSGAQPAGAAACTAFRVSTSLAGFHRRMGVCTSFLQGPVDELRRSGDTAACDRTGGGMLATCLVRLCHGASFHHLVNCLDRLTFASLKEAGHV